MVDRFERFSAAISGISRYWHRISADEMEKKELANSVLMPVLMNA